MNILVTGASGFVGSTLSESLFRQGHKVRLLMRKASSLRNLDTSKFSIVYGDLRDQDSLHEAVTGVDIIFHVAGVISAPRKVGYFQNNTQGTANLAQAAQKNPNLKCFVYVSSLAAGGPASKNKPCSEEDIPQPISDYGRSKLAGEEALRNLNIPSVFVRPPAVYGPKDKGLFPFFQLASRGISLSLSGIREKPGGYSLIHVDDLVQFLITVGTSTKVWSPGEVFYVAEDNIYTWDQMMASMAHAFQKKTLSIPLPLGVLKAAGTVLGTLGRISGKQFLFNQDKAKELCVSYWTCSNTKAKKELGFTPQWSMDSGFSQTAQWYRDRAWL